jgi:hypothetical protein
VGGEFALEKAVYGGNVLDGHLKPLEFVYGAWSVLRKRGQGDVREADFGENGAYGLEGEVVGIAFLGEMGKKEGGEVRGMGLEKSGGGLVIREVAAASRDALLQ